MAGEVKEVETPIDMIVDEFIKELIIALQLPLLDANEFPIIWRIDNKDTGKTLAFDQTLEQNGVLEGHRLILLRATTAGGGYDGVRLVSKGKSLRRIIGRSEESIYGIEDGYLLIPQVMLPLLREHIENDSTSKWFDRFIGFFLGACVGFTVPALDDKSSMTFRTALAGAAVMSLFSVVVLMILERKVEDRRKRIIVPLVERLSAELKEDDKKKAGE